MSDKNRFTPIDLDSEKELGDILANDDGVVVVENEENRPENPMAKKLRQSKPRIDNNMSCKPNKNCRYDPPPPPPPSAVTAASAGGKRKKWGMKQTIKNSKKYKKYKNRKRQHKYKTRRFKKM